MEQVHATAVLFCLSHPIHSPPFSACPVAPEVDAFQFWVGLANRRGQPKTRRQQEREVGRFSHTPSLLQLRVSGGSFVP